MPTSWHFSVYVGEHAEALGLRQGEDFFRFVCQDFVFYTRQYERIRKASLKPEDGLEPVYHVAAFNFTLQYPLLLAPLEVTDPPETVTRKVRAVAIFLDILLARRAANYLSMTFAAMSYAVFLILRDIRGKALGDLVSILTTRLDEQGCDFDGTSDRRRNGLAGFALNQWSARYIKVLLARMTAHLETASGVRSQTSDYLVEGRGRYEIEHIWADHPERHADEFALPAEFAEWRNRFGGLLLLPKTFNASFGDLPYAEKRPHYVSQNLLPGHCMSSATSVTLVFWPTSATPNCHSNHCRSSARLNWKRGSSCIGNSRTACGTLGSWSSKRKRSHEDMGLHDRPILPGQRHWLLR